MNLVCSVFCTTINDGIAVNHNIIDEALSIVVRRLLSDRQIVKLIACHGNNIV